MVDSLPLPPPQVPLMRPDGQGKPTQQGFEFLGRLQSLVKSLASVTNIFNNLTATASTALLNLFTSTLKGLVPGSGGGTTNFLRADGTWAAPPTPASGGLTLIASGSFPAASTWSFTGLGGYKMFVVALRGVQQTSGGTRTFAAALSGNNGSSYGTAFAPVATALGSGALINGLFFITRVDQTNNQLITTSTLAGGATNIDTSSRGPLDALQFSWIGGATNFTAGDIDIYGMK